MGQRGNGRRLSPDADPIQQNIFHVPGLNGDLMKLTQLTKWSLLAGGVAAIGLAGYALSRGSSYQFAGRTILITGGSRGLGLVLARKLGRAGARIAICSRTGAQLQRAAAELRDAGIEVFSQVCDVSDRKAVQELVAAIQDHWGPIDVLINNAGVIQMGPLESQTPEDYELSMATHFWGPLNTMTEVIPAMKARRQGRIVNIASIGGKVCVPHLIPYCASKFALVGLSEGFAEELAQDGIVVTTVCPSLMRTGSPRNALFKGRHRQEYAWFSVAGSLPIMSLGAERAADQIIAAVSRGSSHVVLGFPAKVACLLHDLFPDLAIRAYGYVNQMLPEFGGIGQQTARGADSHSSLSPSLLTTLTEQAAVANNELD